MVHLSTTNVEPLLRCGSQGDLLASAYTKKQASQEAQANAPSLPLPDKPGRADPAPRGPELRRSPRARLTSSDAEAAAYLCTAAGVRQLARGQCGARIWAVAITWFEYRVALLKSFAA